MYPSQTVDCVLYILQHAWSMDDVWRKRSIRSIDGSIDRTTVASCKHTSLCFQSHNVVKWWQLLKHQHVGLVSELLVHFEKLDAQIPDRQKWKVKACKKRNWCQFKLRCQKYCWYWSRATHMLCPSYLCCTPVFTARAMLALQALY